jgi:ABC-type amino acid transport substrate-binding protein
MFGDMNEMIGKLHFPRLLNRLLFVGFFVFGTIHLATPCSLAAEAMRYIYNAPESPLDNRYSYQWKILETALKKTEEKWGPFERKPAVAMSEARQAKELIGNSGRISVMYLSTTAEFEKKLKPIRIPVDRNLGGYCIFLIRDEIESRIRAVKTLDDLRQFSFGLGAGWIDVEILRANGFKVITGPSYEGLFGMLVKKRFDIFLRAAVEILEEFAERKKNLPGVSIEPDFILYYPLPMYFWFSRTPQGEKLANRAKEGMWTMIEDGTYARIFSEYQDAKIKSLRLNERKIFKITNPNLGPETPFDDKRLWFDPQTYVLKE